MRPGKRVVLAITVGGLAAIGGYATFAAGTGSGTAPAPGRSPAAVAQAASPSTSDVKAAGKCCREHGGTGAHDPSKCPMHAKESAAAHASTGTARKCPYLARRAADAAPAGAAPALAAATTGEARKAAYTCPMHPEVKSAEKGRCPKCGMFLEPAR